MNTLEAKLWLGLWWAKKSTLTGWSSSVITVKKGLSVNPTKWDTSEIKYSGEGGRGGMGEGGGEMGMGGREGERGGGRGEGGREGERERGREREGERERGRKGGREMGEGGGEREMGKGGEGRGREGKGGGERRREGGGRGRERQRQSLSIRNKSQINNINNIKLD